MLAVRSFLLLLFYYDTDDTAATPAAGPPCGAYIPSGCGGRTSEPCRAETKRATELAPATAGGRKLPLDVQHGVADRARGDPHLDHLSLLPAQQGLAHRRFVADAVTVRIGLRRPDDHVGQLLAVAQILQDHRTAHGDAVAADLLVVDDLGVAQYRLQLEDAALHEGLLVLGVLVLGRIRQVAKVFGLLDPPSHLLALCDLQVLQFLLELPQALGGEDDFFFALFGHRSSLDKRR